MYRRVLLATVLCLGVTAQPAFAKPVKHGAMDICAIHDGGTVTVVDGTEVCCAHPTTGSSHEFYCVQCDPPGSDNCEEWTATRAPGDQVVTILVRSVLAEQRAIRQELTSLPAKIKELCTPALPTNK